MEIIFHAHHAVVSDHMRQRAERALRKLASRCTRPVDAVVRFEQDGPMRHVEIVLNRARRRPIIAKGAARTYGPALAEAVQRLESQLAHVERPAKPRPRPVARA